jgi:hypothetical protein
MTNVHERLPGAIPPLSSSEPPAGNELALGGGLPTAGSADDRISRLARPVPPDVRSGGVFQQLLAAIQQLIAMLGAGGAANAQSSPQTYFQNADASSTGDPHLAFSGTGLSGSMQQQHFDSMTGHADLLDSASFQGGYRISTKTTQPGANGVTYNERATVSTNYGRTRVSLDKDGDAYLMKNGRRFSIAANHTYDLGHGEMVHRNADGSLEIRENNTEGGSIVTTLSLNGQGVDVRTHAQNVELGGDLMRGASN